MVGGLKPRQLTRRAALAGLAAAGLCARSALPARADTLIDLSWEDLVPPGQTSLPSALRHLLPHDESSPMSSQQPASSGTRADWNGKTVRISGFIVPLDTSAAGVTAFILAPYVGACIHVPPPPANQLVFVTAQTPYGGGGLFEAVSVTGTFAASSLHTALAQIGYGLTADKIEPYRA